MSDGFLKKSDDNEFEIVTESLEMDKYSVKIQSLLEGIFDLRLKSLLDKESSNLSQIKKMKKKTKGMTQLASFLKKYF